MNTTKQPLDTPDSFYQLFKAYSYPTIGSTEMGDYGHITYIDTKYPSPLKAPFYFALSGDVWANGGYVGLVSAGIILPSSTVSYGVFGLSLNYVALVTASPFRPSHGNPVRCLAR